MTSAFLAAPNRRKKCDKTKPVCERCVKSDFECLGYDDDEGRKSGAPEKTGEISERGTPSKKTLQSILPKPAESVSLTGHQPLVSDSRIVIIHKLQLTPSKLADRTGKETPYASSLGTADVGSGPSPSFAETFTFQEHPTHINMDLALASLADGLRDGPLTRPSDNITSIYPTGNHFNDLWPQNHSQTLTCSTSFLQPIPTVRNGTRRRDPGVSSAINALGQVMDILCRNIPPSVNASASMKESYYAFTIGQCENLSIIKELLILRS